MEVRISFGEQCHAHFYSVAEVHRLRRSLTYEAAVEKKAGMRHQWVHLLGRHMMGLQYHLSLHSQPVQFSCAAAFCRLSVWTAAWNSALGSWPPTLIARI